MNERKSPPSRASDQRAVPSPAVAAPGTGADVLFRLAADVAPVPMWIGESPAVRTWFNQPWLALVGRSLADEAGDGWTHSIHPEDLDRSVAAYARASGTREHFSLEYRLRRHDGQYRIMRDQGRPFDGPDGVCAGYVGSCTDITEQRRDAEAQGYLAAIVASSDDAIISKDLNGIIQSCNRSAEQLFGYTALELIGRPVRLLIPPDRQYEEDDILARIRRGERVDHFETVRRRKDGQELDISLTVSPVRNERGEIVGVSKIARDITERKRATTELLAQQAWFRITLGSIGDAVIAADPQGRVSFMNSVAEGLTGWTSAESTGQPLVEVFHVVNERTRERVENPASLVMGHGRIVGFSNHSVLIGRGGFERPISSSAAPILAGEGRMIGVVLVFRDVTEQRRSAEAVAEQREWFKTTLESIGDAVIATDVHGHVVFMNSVAERLTGWRGEQAAGQACTRVFRIVEEGSRRDVENPVTRVLAEGVTVGLANHTLLIAADGTERPIDDSGAPIRNSDGRVVGAVLVFRDVSDRRRVEAERQMAAAERDRLLESERLARSEAEKASRVKDDFVAMVSHELRTPLNAILGWTQLMSQGRNDPAMIERGLDVVARNTRVQAQLIADLLDISRISAGKLQLDFQSADLAVILRDAVDTVLRDAEHKEIALVQHVDGDMAPIAGDPARLQQIIWNLLSNAIKFTPAGGRVAVQLSRQGEQLVLIVADTGSGIAPEVLPHIFERFHQADRSITRRFGGLGLGLAIVKHLVHLHGGTVQVDSAGPGEGTTFTVTFPAAGDVPSGIAPVGVTQAADVGHVVSLEGLRVLVVEDEADTRDFLVRLLGNHGALVTVAATAAEALVQFHASRPDVLISDIGLPDVDGYDLIRRIREESPRHLPRVPAIALTAYVRSEDRTRALLAGFQGHLAKPIEAAELVATVSSFRAVIEAADQAETQERPTR